MRTGELLLFFSFLVSLALWFQLCFAGDTLIAGQEITQNRTGNLVSSSRTFELGFFSLSGEKKYYLGIWYRELEKETQKAVWVANRDKPVEDSSRVFRIAEDGNMVVEGASSKRYWSSKLEASSSTNRTVKLLDSGNLVLMDDNLGITSYLWQSFQNPTDTFLPGMKMDANLSLISWKDATDPSPGNFSFKLIHGQKFVVEKHLKRYWTLDAIDYRIARLLENATSGKVPYKLSGITLNPGRAYRYGKSMLLMNYSGEIQFLKWDEDDRQWDKRWSRPADKCDIYNCCGSFGFCNKNNLNLNLEPCRCLPGFRRRPAGEIQDKGCVRKSTSSCIDKKDVMFLNLTNIKVGDLPDQESFDGTEAECQSLCLNNNTKCSESQCQAYSYSNSTSYDRDHSSTCKIWRRDLSTLLERYNSDFLEEFVPGPILSILVKRSDIVPYAKSCEPCGIYVIPYPLSTGPNCGDPMYNNFNCNKSTGQVTFKILGGTSHQVIWIDEDTRMFYIQPNGSYPCNSSNQNITPNFPFNVTDQCSEADDDGKIKITWLPAPEPPCTELIDCHNWPHSTCRETSEGGSRCRCDSNYKWNNTIMSCTLEEHSTNQLELILIVILSGMAILACTIAFAIVRRKKKAHELGQANARIQESLYESERHVKGLIGLGSLAEKDIEGIEVPCYTFASILAATANFSDSNKLGRGGYGPVYKGTFPGGQDIAVKRLSSVSTQGLQEFKNEVILIAKLQHRNLVRLRGYCIKGDEKILLYEYMPNKSLDSFIFDRTRTLLLDWPMRFEIILGIARGLLYLHQDSRLRVIHRDLKTSNILLDEDMNPKISDFGLAKIFGGKETEASTERIVGTYGYMAPEYALDGFFSIKSDVFSFGVVLLEILSGKKNTGFYQSKQISSLLGHAWKLWTEKKLLDLMDQSLGETCNENQFIKCAVIGLLCIQDEPGDRPTMSNVLYMLDIETATMPIPTQPTFFVNKHFSSSASSSSKPEISLQFESSYQEGR
ncbi:hypothetical protein GLYMA_13G303800v4 [Glycine max]|uniref:non-specific serine/threonine protein kinase n=1 Tax=Glycine max TaxID=3847 RepID=K7M2T9_SOYBN|nr:G-type lectin S-receptor-like serine/threonine-protein kinase At4g03230 isoform X1 [Glycine max]KAG4972061.1 hypothetical protein JHK85_038482 [Glycine max]KAH1218725.1 G-type lectin S-receptor-like serine/threonine-protein kinase [Glycine max]KRH22490.1 hypothetical protein GLYMA_13G303800v4 [Glycine max]|eukprot:XP_003541927.1 G-type lectin S-receptor-like serine/threonine-protein kinase At4g03230 isoform X1 [Glycine max]